MTECCLLYCFRPNTYQRLLNNAIASKELSFNSRQKKIDQLTSYLTAFPKKIPVSNLSVVLLSESDNESIIMQDLLRIVNKKIKKNIHSKNKRQYDIVIYGEKRRFDLLTFQSSICFEKSP